MSKFPTHQAIFSLRSSALHPYFLFSLFAFLIWEDLEFLKKRKFVSANTPFVATMQTKCLRAITGAYKATNIKVLEAEAGVVPLDLYLDQAVLRSRDTPRCCEEVGLVKPRFEGNYGTKEGENISQGPLP